MKNKSKKRKCMKRPREKKTTEKDIEDAINYQLFFSISVNSGFGNIYLAAFAAR